MMHLTSPQRRSTHARRGSPYKKKTMKKLADIDSSELLPEDVGERSLSHLDFDVHKPQQTCDFPDSFSTVKTALMSDNEWYGYGESCEDNNDNDEDDDDVQSFANCSPLPSGRSSLPRGEWLADLMINKDRNDPAHATKWVYAPDGSCQHLELDIRLLQHSGVAAAAPTSPTLSSSSSPSSNSPRGTKLSHLIGANPLHIPSSSIFDFKRRIQKMPRRLSTSNY
jgi:hypothetical protein